MVANNLRPSSCWRQLARSPTDGLGMAPDWLDCQLSRVSRSRCEAAVVRPHEVCAHESLRDSVRLEAGVSALPPGPPAWPGNRAPRGSFRFLRGDGRQPAAKYPCRSRLGREAVPPPSCYHSADAYRAASGCPFNHRGDESEGRYYDRRQTGPDPLRNHQWINAIDLQYLIDP